MKYDGHLAFIPGGSTGIGLAIAERLAAAGAEVVVFARRREPLVAAVESIGAKRRRREQRVEWRQLDVAEPAQVSAVLDEAVRAFGVPDLLINCAGRALPNYFERISAAQLEETLRINLFGCWHTTQALAPAMRARGSGYIVNTASLAGLIGTFGYTDYCASKFALVGFSEALRCELAPHGVSVSVLCPPDVDTPGFAEENRNKPPETVAVSAGASLLDAGAVADALLAGMARRRFLIVPGREARFAWWAQRLVPGLVRRVMDRQVRGVRK